MSKPSQTTIHPDDVEAIVRDFDKKPEPNPRMVEAHRKAREIFQQPMSKPSEKAMQLAQRYANVVNHLNIKEKNELAIAWAKEIDAHTAEALTEHQRVIDSCKVALELSNVQNNLAQQEVQDALAEIAKLRKE